MANVTFSGTNTLRYGFELYSLDTFFSDLSAVYMFAVKDIKGGKSVFTPLYINETTELGSTIMNHGNLPAVIEEGANCVLVYPVENDLLRRTVARDLNSANLRKVYICP